MSYLTTRVLTRLKDICDIRGKQSLSSDESEFQNLVSQFWNVDLAKEITDPLLKRYVEYSLSTNERAEQLVNRVANYTDIRGKRYLDVGCVMVDV